jgi:Ni/Co efflux regulator RcnB
MPTTQEPTQSTPATEAPVRPSFGGVAPPSPDVLGDDADLPPLDNLRLSSQSPIAPDDGDQGNGDDAGQPPAGSDDAPDPSAPIDPPAPAEGSTDGAPAQDAAAAPADPDKGNLPKYVEKLATQQRDQQRRIEALHESLLAAIQGLSGKAAAPANAGAAAPADAPPVATPEDDPLAGDERDIPTIGQMRALRAQLQEQILKDLEKRQTQAEQGRQAMVQQEQQWVEAFDAREPAAMKGKGPEVMAAYRARLARYGNGQGLSEEARQALAHDAYEVAYREVAGKRAPSPGTGSAASAARASGSGTAKPPSVNRAPPPVKPPGATARTPQTNSDDDDDGRPLRLSSRSGR